jgi:protoporphyrinogen oxidase
MVADPDTVWLGLEYFCDETDDLWKMQDSELIELAKTELCKLRFVEPENLIGGTVVRAPKAYPAYFGTYNKFAEIRGFTDQFENLFLIGRNGMHRYNNQDHSMLTAMLAVDQIINNVSGRDALWALNSEPDYQEEK